MNILFLTLFYSVVIFYIAQVQSFFKELLNDVCPETNMYPYKEIKYKINYIMWLWEHIHESVTILKFIFLFLWRWMSLFLIKQ